MRKVLSYSFFRNDQSAYESERSGVARGRFFVNFLPAILRAWYSVMPDFDVIIYHDDRVTKYRYFSVLTELQERGHIELHYIGKANRLCESMLWRILPTWEPSVDILLCRDIDSLVTPREEKAISRWLGFKDFPIHAASDSESHDSGILMGGMIGLKCEWVRAEITKQMFNGWVVKHDLLKHGSDQDFLNKYFRPIFKTKILYDTKQTLPPKSDPRDFLTNHMGAAFHTQPVVEWYDQNDPWHELQEIEREMDCAQHDRIA